MYLCSDFKMLPTRQQVAAHKPQRLSSSLSSDCHCTHVLTTLRYISSRLHDRTTRVQLPSRKLPIKCFTVILYIATAYNTALVPKPKVYLLYHHYAIMHLHRIFFAQRTLKQFHMGKKVTMRVPNPTVMKQHSKANRKNIIRFSARTEAWSVSTRKRLPVPLTVSI